jgi:hypothetical protein
LIVRVNDCCFYSCIMARTSYILMIIRWCVSWSHCCKNYTVVITQCWPLRNIHMSNNNGSLTFYVDVFFPLSLSRLLPDLVTRWVSYRKQELLAPEFTPRFVVGFMLLTFLISCVVLLCVFTFWVPCCDVRCNFA